MNLINLKENNSKGDINKKVRSAICLDNKNI